MKKKFWVACAMVLLLVGVSANGFALSISDLYTETYWEPSGGYDYGTSDYGAGLGVYIGTGIGNLSDPDFISFFENSGYTDASMTDLSITGQNSIAGTWTANDPVASENYVDFLVVKGGTSFSVHQYNADTYGIWNVGWLADAGGSGAPPEMSHLSAAYTGGGNGTPVPEPATLFLLGSGLVGLWGLRRKFKK